MVFVPKISMNETPEMSLALTLFVMGPVWLLLEGSGLNLGYSKFVNLVDKSPPVPSRLAMFIMYFPALLLYLLMHVIADRADVDSPFHTTLAVMICGHFIKRCLEVLFVHKYSGSINLFTCTFVTTGYLVICTVLAVTSIKRLPASSSYPEGYAHGNLHLGLLLWTVGQVGNGYSHILLARLRTSEEDKSYKVPCGFLFSLVCCPHYACELVAWTGVCVVYNHLAAVFVMGFMVGYLFGRGRSTLRWYVAKQREMDFKLPAKWRAIVPYLY